MVAVPVSRLVADHMTALSRVLSGNPGSLGYPQTVKHDLWAAWAVTHAVYHDSLNEGEPTLWRGLVKKCVNARQAAAFSVDETTGTSRPST